MTKPGNGSRIKSPDLTEVDLPMVSCTIEIGLFGSRVEEKRNSLKAKPVGGHCIMGHYLGGRRKAKGLAAMPEVFCVDAGKQSPLELYTRYVEKGNYPTSLPRFVVLWVCLAPSQRQWRIGRRPGAYPEKKSKIKKSGSSKTSKKQRPVSISGPRKFGGRGYNKGGEERRP